MKEEEQHILLETAKLAKEKGFNIPIYHHYSENPVNDLQLLVYPDNPQVGMGWKLTNYNSNDWVFNKWSAPSQSLLQKWLRDVKNIHITIDIVNLGSDEYTWTLYDLYEEKRIKESFVGAGNSYHGTFNTYEEALEDALVESLKII